ncbi:MAG: TonB-dependent receptor [Gammaproteobacteria bacterium]|nr:TonB-dependent receptor [Gammaproteobacteria bacterium]
MSRLPFAACVAACLLNLPTGAAAQTTAQLTPVVVTATRTPLPASDTLNTTIVITRPQIERAQATDVADLLSQYAGLEVARVGGPGQPASLFIRGGNSNYTLVLIDGVRVNDGSDGAAALNRIAPEMIERIEIIEGPAAALYGSDAIGGVVNVITRKPGPGHAWAAIGGGSFGTVSGAAALRGQGALGAGGWGAALSLQQQHSDGIPTFAGAGQARGFRNRSVNARLDYALGDWRFEARVWDARGATQFLNQTFDPNTFAFTGFSPADEDFENRIVAVQADWRITPRWRSSLTLSQSEDRLQQKQTPDFVRTLRPEADWHNVFTVDAHNRLSFGLRDDRERVDGLSFGSGLRQNKTVAYGYLQDEIHYGAQRLIGAVNYLHDDAFGERFDWSLRYGYDLAAGTRLIVSAGTAFHAPTANDRFGFGGNPALEPEKSQTYEFGLQQQLWRHQRLEARLFWTDVRDLIQFLPVPGQAFEFRGENVAHARNQGLQLSWHYTGGDWQARVGGLWQDPRDRDAHRQLLRRARLSASAQLTRRFGRYDLGAVFVASRARADIDALTGAPTADGGYGRLDLLGSVRLTSRLRLDVRADNVLNKHYQTAAGFNQPGSAAYATLRYDLPLGEEP